MKYRDTRFPSDSNDILYSILGCIAFILFHYFFFFTFGNFPLHTWQAVTAWHSGWKIPRTVCLNTWFCLAGRYALCARETSAQSSFELSVSINKAEAKAQIWMKIMKKWQRLCDAQGKVKHLYSIQRKVGTGRDWKGRNNFTRLRVRHCGLNKYLYIIGKHQEHVNFAIVLILSNIWCLNVKSMRGKG